MDLTPYVVSVEESLLAAAAAGDDTTRRAATALSAALEPAVRLALLNALADVAAELGDELGDRRVEARLDAGDLRLVVWTSAPAEEVRDELPEAAGAGSEPSRITLRLPESLKAQAEQAAAAEALSLNTWLIRAVQEALRHGRAGAGRSPDAAGRRVRGWVQA